MGHEWAITRNSLPFNGNVSPICFFEAYFCECPGLLYCVFLPGDSFGYFTIYVNSFTKCWMHELNYQAYCKIYNEITFCIYHFPSLCWLHLCIRLSGRFRCFTLEQHSLASSFHSFFGLSTCLLDMVCSIPRNCFKVTQILITPSSFSFKLVGLASSLFLNLLLSTDN